MSIPRHTRAQAPNTTLRALRRFLQTLNTPMALYEVIVSYTAHKADQQSASLFAEKVCSSNVSTTAFRGVQSEAAKKYIYTGAKKTTAEHSSPAITEVQTRVRYRLCLSRAIYFSLCSARARAACSQKKGRPRPDTWRGY